MQVIAITCSLQLGNYEETVGTFENTLKRIMYIKSISSRRVKDYIRLMLLRRGHILYRYYYFLFTSFYSLAPSPISQPNAVKTRWLWGCWYLKRTRCAASPASKLPRTPLELCRSAKQHSRTPVISPKKHCTLCFSLVSAVFFIIYSIG